MEEVVKLRIPRPVLVVRYRPLLAHCPIDVVAKFKIPRLVEVVIQFGL